MAWGRWLPRAGGRRGLTLPLVVLEMAQTRENLLPSLCCPQIPILQAAQAVAKRPLSLYASPWTSPVWMKTNGAMTGRGTLKGNPGDKYHKAWAKYFIR